MLTILLCLLLYLPVIYKEGGGPGLVLHLTYVSSQHICIQRYRYLMIMHYAATEQFNWITATFYFR